MRINLADNSIFNAFEQFASSQMADRNVKAVARVGQGGHNIVATTGDRVGAIARSLANRTANNSVREMFQNMIIDIFEGRNNIPENVLNVMKMQDYDHGKPLTARRISAVCAEIRICAERERQNLHVQENLSKVQTIGRLLGGESVASIVGEGRGEGWAEFAAHLGDMLTSAAKNAENVAPDVSVPLLHPFDGSTVLSLSPDGKVIATITVDGEVGVVNTGKTPEEFSAAAISSLLGLDSAFADVAVDNICMGRTLLASRTLPELRDHASMPDAEPCPLRSFACALLIAKAGVTQEQLDEFSNVQLANFAQTLLENPPENDANVKTSIEQAIANKYVELQNVVDDLDNHGENHVVIQNEQQMNGEAQPQIIEPPQPNVFALNVPEPPGQPPEVPDYDSMRYSILEAANTTTYEATIVGNKFMMMLIETRNAGAEAAANAHAVLRKFARVNLDILLLLAKKTISVGNAESPDRKKKVESIVEPKIVEELAKQFVDEFSDEADLSELTNGQVSAIKKALSSKDVKPGLAKIAEKADHALLFAKLRGDYFNEVARTNALRDNVDVITARYESEADEYPIEQKGNSKSVVSFLEKVVNLSEKAVKDGTENKTFKPGSNGERLVAKLLGENTHARLPQVLANQEKAKALRDAFDANFEYFIRFIFDRDNALSAVPLPLRQEMAQLADSIRAMMVEMTGCTALSGNARLSALPGHAVDAVKSFLKNDVALERIAQLFAVANPTSEIFKSRFAPKAKEVEDVRLMKDALDAIPGDEYLARDPDYVSFASPQGLRSVIQQFAQIATSPALQKPDAAKAFLTANNNRALKAILATLSNPSLLNAAVVPQLRKVVRNFMEAIVRHISAELPERKIDFAKLSKGDIDAICSLFADPMSEIDPETTGKAKVEELKTKAAEIAAKRAAALDRAMPGVAHAFVDFQKDVGNAVQDLVDKVFNLKALKTGGVVKSPYENMTPAEVKAHLDKLDLDEILDDANVNPNRPGTLAFTMNILQSYFAKLKPEAMRDILANALCTEPAKEGEAQVEGDCRLLSGVFQGTGPLLQKMLQGLDKRVLAPEYRDTFGKVLDNMKSSMRPLSEEYVNEKLEAFMKKSGGKVYYMKAGQSLGAATVGQTFLCKMKHKVVEKGFLRNTERNVDEEVVVKVMRPNIHKIAKAEKEVFDEAAKKVPGMESAWKAQYATIEKEFDFRNEAQNVKDGSFYQVAGTKVDLDIAPNLHVMTLPADTSATEDVIVLKKARGVPLDKQISDTRKVLHHTFSKVFQTDPETGLFKTDENGKLLVRPDAKPNDLIYARRDSTQLVEGLFCSVRLLKHASAKWMKEAFFNSGFFHNDLHGGNLMVDIGKSRKTDVVTMIDFGNLMKLEQGDRSCLCNMMIYSAARDVDSFCDELFALVNAHAKTSAISLSNDVKAKIKAMVDSILHKGKAGEDAGYRFLAILEELRKFGVTLPEAIYGVSRGLSRLQSALDDMADSIKKSHAVYSAFFGDVESVLPKDGIFGKDNIHGGFLGKLYTCLLTTSTGKDAEAKIAALIKEVTDGDFDNDVENYIKKLVAAKDFERGADELDDLLRLLYILPDGCEHIKGLWTNITELASKENRTKDDDEALDNLINEISEKITDAEWAGARYYTMLAKEREDTDRIKEEEELVYTKGKKKGQAYIYKEWEARVWSLPEVINDVVDSATSGFFDKAAFVSKLGYKKAKQTFDKIEHGKDFPLGHKKIAA